MKHFSLAASSCWLLSASFLLPNSCSLTSAAFFPSLTTSSRHTRSLLPTTTTNNNNKVSPPSISPGQSSPPMAMIPPTHRSFSTSSSSASPPLTRRKYANDQTVPSSELSTPTTSSSVSSTTTMHVIAAAEQRRQEWINSSVNYYTKVMREERRRRLGQLAEEEDTVCHVDNDDDDECTSQRQSNQKKDGNFNSLAAKHYFALRKIKDGKAHHAELIYRRIIGELQQDVDCDNAKLAVTTLLLALLLQRGVGTSAKQTRSVFLNFFRVALLSGHDNKNVFAATNNNINEQCACSAKVMQAYALFEMKQGNSLKSLQLVQKAIQLDPSLTPVLNWKQFRDAATAAQVYNGGMSR